MRTVARLFQFGGDCPALIKDKIIANKLRSATRLVIIDDSAFQLIHIFKTVFFGKSHGFLAANATSAIHQKGFVLLIAVGLQKFLGEFPKLFKPQVLSVAKTAVINFKIISGI